MDLLLEGCLYHLLERGGWEEARPPLPMWRSEWWHYPALLNLMCTPGKWGECMVLKKVPQALHCFYAEAVTCNMGHVGDAKEAGGAWAAFSCFSTPPSTTRDVEGNTVVFSPPPSRLHNLTCPASLYPSSVAYALTHLPPIPHLPTPTDCSLNLKFPDLSCTPVPL